MKTLLICGVLLVLTKAEAVCSGDLITLGSECVSEQPCVSYKALGCPLYLQLPNKSELILIKTISKDKSDPILKFTDPNIFKSSSDPNWQFSTKNKTIIKSKAEKKDSGQYKLETFERGINQGTYYLQLNIQAVVSSVEVGDSCFPRTNRSVYCSSAGDQIQFSWTFSGTPPDYSLTDGNRTLLLDKGYTGSVTCHVKNQVSNGFKTLELLECAKSTAVTTTTTNKTTSSAVSTTMALTHSHNSTKSQDSKPFPFLYMTLIVLGSITVLLIVVSIILCYVYKKKQARKDTGSSQNGDELLYVQVKHKPKGRENQTSSPAQAQENEVEYATVVTKPQQKKKKKEQKEEEVEYGDIVFKTSAKQRREEPEEGCVYSQVQHKR